MTESVIWLHKAIFTDSRKQQDIIGALLCCQCIAGDSPLSTPVSGKPANLLTTAKQQFLTGNWLTRWVPIALRRRLAPGLPMNFYKKVYHRNKSLPRLFLKKSRKMFWNSKQRGVIHHNHIVEGKRICTPPAGGKSQSGGNSSSANSASVSRFSFSLVRP